MKDQEIPLLKLIRFLSDPAVYPEKTQKVEILQTHASVVALCDSFVYKFKKNINLGFLDFSDLEKRKFYGEEEIRLNRRLASDVYIGLVPLYVSENELSFSKKEGDIFEYAVKMHRLDSDFFLIHLICDESFGLEQCQGLCDKLIRFYQGQIPAQEIKNWGEPEKIRISIEENFQQMQVFANHIFDARDLEYIQRYQSGFLSGHRGLFHQRIREEKIKDCHGDLRSEHIFIQDKRVEVFDCIEFNERFRYIDQLNDLAFLAMDLEYRKRFDLSFGILKTILSKIEEAEIRSLLNFYKSYRACVRAKVDAIKGSETEIEEELRKLSVEKAKNYLGLALRYALLGSGPVILVFKGKIATGKSTLAALMADKLYLNHLNSDVIRKSLAGLDPFRLSDQKQKSQLYSNDMTVRTYQNLIDRGLEICLKEGSVVLDGTFQSATYMALLENQARISGVKIVWIETTADEEIIKKRLQAREKEKNASDARIEDFESLYHQKAYPYQPTFPFLSLHTSGEMMNNLDQIYVFLQNLLPA